MSSTTDTIKTRLSVQDVIGSYIKLEKAGANFKARCPFHNERTPSFFVSPARGSYYCFGCNKGGDIFAFVQDVEGLDFKGALKVLAERAGVPLETFAGGNKDDLDILREIMEAATLFYERELAETQEAQQYIKGRGIHADTVKRFRIGFAPDSWRKCFDFLTAKGYSPKDIALAGLSVEGKQGSSYDRFRQRIMFPISDPSGRVVAFSGRIMPSQAMPQTIHDVNAQGKYVNSPQTPLYNKGAILYGFDKAKMAMRKEDTCILVEGQIDLVMSHQAGYAHTVAVSGTALTKEHLSMIQRMTNNLVLAFDADKAGVASSRRAVELAFELSMEVHIAKISSGKDPADVIRENPERWKESIAHRMPVVEFYLEQCKQEHDVRIMRRRVEAEVIPFVARIKSPIEQAHFISRTAEEANVSEETIRESVRMAHRDTSIEPKGESPKPQSGKRDMLLTRLAGILFWQESQAHPGMDTRDLRSMLETTLDEKFGSWMNDREAERSRLIFEAEAYYAGSQNVYKDVDELTRSLEGEALKEEFRRIVERLKVKGIDPEETSELLKRSHEVAKRLEDLKKQGIQ